LTKDPILHRVQSMMFPHFKRYEKVKMKKYIESHACAYQISDPLKAKIQTSEFNSNTYSHVAFERSILRHKTLKKQYIDMVVDLADRAYYQNKVETDKLAIFVSSRIMADAMLEAVKIRFPELDSRIYMEGATLQDALDPDIRITTITSAGTALDIPNLRVTIMTINVDSPIANAQCLGRLREMKHRTKDNDVHFYYTYCSTIPKQVDYHRNKVALFKERVVSQKDHFIATLYP
jgi:superfamily II DNA or RNA helicase